MKKLFEIPQLKVVRFEEADIILSSGGCVDVYYYCVATYSGSDSPGCIDPYYFECAGYNYTGGASCSDVRCADYRSNSLFVF